MKAILVFSILLTVSTAASAQDPVKVDPSHYRILFENAHIRVLEYRDKPGDEAPMHSHPAYMTYVTGAGKTKVILPGGGTKIEESTSSESDCHMPTRHATENVGTTDTQGLLVEFKDSYDPCFESVGSADSVEQEIAQLEQQFSDAEVHKDIQRMSMLMADDLTDVEDDGSIWTKPDIIKLFQSPATMLERDTISELRIRQYGDTAIVTLLDSADFTVNGKDMGGEFRLTDVWVRRGSKWQLVAFQSSKIKRIADAFQGPSKEASSVEASNNQGRTQPQPSRGMLSESKDVLTLKRLEQDWLDAYREGDAEKMGKILADDFIGRWADGSTQTKKEQLKAIWTGEEKHSANQLVECNVRIYGETAVVTGIQTEQSILGGRDGSGMYSYTDVFVKRDGHWQVVATETKRVSSQSTGFKHIGLTCSSYL